MPSMSTANGSLPRLISATTPSSVRGRATTRAPQVAGGADRSAGGRTGDGGDDPDVALRAGVADLVDLGVVGVRERGQDSLHVGGVNRGPRAVVGAVLHRDRDGSVGQRAGLDDEHAGPERVVLVHLVDGGAVGRTVRSGRDRESRSSDALVVDAVTHSFSFQMWAARRVNAGRPTVEGPGSDH